MINGKPDRDITPDLKKLLDVDDEQARALAVLFGYYNRFGRLMRIQNYEDCRERFSKIVDEVADQL